MTLWHEFVLSVFGMLAVGFICAGFCDSYFRSSLRAFYRRIVPLKKPKRDVFIELDAFKYGSQLTLDKLVSGLNSQRARIGRLEDRMQELENKQLEAVGSIRMLRDYVKSQPSEIKKQKTKKRKK